MTAKETTLEEIGGMLTHVVGHMATKDELKEFRDEFKEFGEGTAENFHALRTEVADIRRDLEYLRSRVDNATGYSKEIDHALSRIARIERHLGIDTKAAA